MKKTLFIALCLSLMCTNSMLGQRLCGYDVMHKAALAKNPKFDSVRNAILNTNNTRYAKKTSSLPTVKIPIVFHILLDNASLTQMDASTIEDRVRSQVQVLNEDYDRGNVDSTLIPSAFKPLYAGANIVFCLTGKDPSGAYTPGWEFVSTTSTGFECNSTPDHGGNAKHAATGGVNAWDETKYLNVWVANLLWNGIANKIVGLTVPMSWATAGTNDSSEVGILLNYSVFGRRSSSTEYFFTNLDKGRTLTHEIGHYFELLHTWGDDGGGCPGSGGTDDGIADTPPQGTSDFGCPSFPKTDACSPSSPGIMFMNFMDYTDDACMQMFTIDQAIKMHSNLESGGETYTLTTHHDLLGTPNVTPIPSELIVSPNPTTGNITITTTNDTPISICIYNTIGQIVKSIPTQASNYIYNTDISAMPKGIYIVECTYTDRKVVRKISLQ